MANNLMLNVNNDFDVNKLAEELAKFYKSGGFKTTVVRLNDNTCIVELDKGTGGINMLLGMGLGIKVNISAKNGLLNVSYSDAEWTGKIVGFAVGLFICIIPVITAAIGTFKQLNFPTEINNNITRLVCYMTA